MKLIKFSIILLTFIVPSFVLAQDVVEIYRAEVLKINSTEESLIPGTSISGIVQDLNVKILNGDKKGEEINFKNDFIELEEGQTIYLRIITTTEGQNYYTVSEVDRSIPLILVTLLFVAVVIIFGGRQGLKSILSLVLSLASIVFVLLPLILKGYPPLWVSIIVATIILFFAIYITHGFNVRSTIAFVGTVSAVLISGILATIFVKASALTGFSADESVYLNISTGGEIDFIGLLLGAIIIGALGALDDIAVTQVSVVRELFAANKSLSRISVYKRALQVGKEHVGALVNTLVLAYTATALPTLLLLYISELSFGFLINNEIIASEIIRTLVGSIGLVLTVPITTYLATVVMEKRKDKLESGSGDVHCCHGHGH